MSERNYLDYFEFDGQKYPLNTVVKIKKDFYTTTHNLWYLSDYPMVQVVESFVDWQGINRLTFAIWKKNGHVVSFTTAQDIIESVIEFSENETETNESEYYNDFEVSEVIVGWLKYFAVMFFGIVFKEVVVFWVFATVYFFLWRKEKLRKTIEYKYGFNVDKKVREWDERQA